MLRRLCLVTQLCLTLQPHGLQPTRLLCAWEFSRKEYWSGSSCPPLRDHPNPGIEPRSPALQADSLPTEPPGKPKNTGVGSLSLLQRIFPTQELNWGLLHCRWIRYQLSCHVKCKIESVSCSVMYGSLRPPWTVAPPGSSVRRILQGRTLEWVTIPSPGIFPAQGLNLGLPHCRQIFYHLIHQGGPKKDGYYQKDKR